MRRAVLRTTSALVVASAVAVSGLSLTTETAQATPKPAWRVSLTVVNPAVTLGRKVRMQGHVSKAAAGLLAMLQERAAPDRPWHDQRQARVHADGTFTTYDVPTSNRTREYRVVMPRTQRRARGVSPAVSVAVYAWTQLTSFPQSNPRFLPAVASVSMNGVAYPASLEATTFHPNGPTTQSVEYNLDHRCLRFRGTFGLSDDSQSGAQASVEADADGAPWFDHTYAIGESTANTFDFETAPLKVHVQTTSLVAGLDGLGAVGTPEVFCTR